MRNCSINRFTTKKSAWIVWFFNFSSTEILIFSLILDQIDLQTKVSEFLSNSAIKTQKTQKFWVNSEILSFVEPLTSVTKFPYLGKPSFVKKKIQNFCQILPLKPKTQKFWVNSEILSFVEPLPWILDSHNKNWAGMIMRRSAETNLIFVTGTTGGACVNLFCLV